MAIAETLDGVSREHLTLYIEDGYVVVDIEVGGDTGATPIDIVFTEPDGTTTSFDTNGTRTSVTVDGTITTVTTDGTTTTEQGEPPTVDESAAIVAYASTAQAAAAVYSEKVAGIIQQDSFTDVIAEAVNQPVIIIEAPTWQEVVLSAPSPPPPSPPPPATPPVPPQIPSPPISPPPFICYPIYGAGDCSEYNYCGASEGRGECDGGQCRCALGFGGLNCSFAPRCRFWDAALGMWSSEGMETVEQSDGVLHCRTSRLASTEYAGVWEVVAFAHTPQPPPPPMASPPSMPLFQNPIFMALVFITVFDVLGLLVAVNRTRVRRPRAPKVEEPVATVNEPPSEEEPSATDSALGAVRDALADAKAAVEEAAKDAAAYLQEKLDDKPPPILLLPWNANGAPTIQERIMPMAGIMPTPGNGSQPRRALTRLRLQQQESGASTPPAGPVTARLNEIRPAPTQADGIQERIPPLAVSRKQLSYRGTPYKGIKLAPSASGMLSTMSTQPPSPGSPGSQQVTPPKVDPLSPPSPLTPSHAGPAQLAPTSNASLIPNERIPRMGTCTTPLGSQRSLATLGPGLVRGESSLAQTMPPRRLVLARAAPEEGRSTSTTVARPALRRDPSMMSGRCMVMSQPTGLTAPYRPPAVDPARSAWGTPSKGASDAPPTPPPSPPASMIASSSSSPPSPPSDEAAAVPDAFNCPIGHSLMIDPVTSADGHSYERENIEKWLAVQHTSPLTGAVLQHLELTPNHALRKAIQEWLDQQGGPLQLHDVRPPPGPAPPKAQSSKLRISAPQAPAPPAYRTAPPAPAPPSTPPAKGTERPTPLKIERPTTPLKGALGSRPTTPGTPSVVGAVQQRIATPSKVAPQSPAKPPAEAPLKIKQPPIVPVRPPSAGKSKVAGDGKQADAPEQRVVGSMQQRVRPHPKVAGTRARVATVGEATPSMETEHHLSDVLYLHSWLGCMFALFGKTSATAISTGPEAVHIFSSGLVFIVFTVSAQLMLFDGDGVPLVRLDTMPATAVTAVVATAASIAVACTQRFAFALAKMPVQVGLLEKIAWRVGAWTLNLLLYAGAVAGSYQISHYKLSLEEESVDFPPRAALAVLLNLLVAEPLLVVGFLAAIVARRHRRPKIESKAGADETTPPIPKKVA